MEWADIEELLREQPDRENAAQSILSSACVEDIAERVFLERYRSPLLPESRAHLSLWHRSKSPLISTRLEPGVAGKNTAQTVSTVCARLGGAERPVESR